MKIQRNYCPRCPIPKLMWNGFGTAQQLMEFAVYARHPLFRVSCGLGMWQRCQIHNESKQSGYTRDVWAMRSFKWHQVNG